MFVNMGEYERLQAMPQKAFENNRLREADARAAEIHARRQKEWTDSDAIQGEVRRQAGEMDFGADYQDPTLQGLGIRKLPPAQMPEVSGQGGQLGLAKPVDNYGPTNDPTAPMPTQQPSAAKTVDPRISALQNRLKLAKISGKQEELAAVQSEFYALKRAEAKMAISDHIDKADTVEMDRLVGGITSDPTNKIKAVFNEKTGYTTLITEDGKEEKLNRKDLKAYLIAKLDMNFDAMAKAKGGAQERADRQGDQLVKITGPNNTAAHFANTDALGRERNGLMRDRAQAGNREPDQALIEENNRIYAAMQEATTPEQRKGLEKQYRANQVRIANSMGKAMQLPQDRDRPAVDEASIAKYMDMLSPEELKLPLASRRGLVIRMLTGQDGGGGLPAWGEGAAKPGLKLPRGGQSGSHTVAPQTVQPGSDVGARVRLPGIDPEVGLGLMLNQPQGRGISSMLNNTR